MQVFLGQKYGYRPIPAEILASEFELLRDCAKQNSDDLKLLDDWYKRDDNFVPAVYVLQPISSILTNFNNKVILIHALALTNPKVDGMCL